MQGEQFPCKWCGVMLVSGDRDGNNRHFLDHHVTDYIDELERRGADELQAHQRVNELVGGLRTPTR